MVGGIKMNEEQFEDCPEALAENDTQRYYPKPYVDYYRTIKFIPSEEEVRKMKKQPKGVKATYGSYADIRSKGQ